jgi:hypothetical protein
MKLFILGLIVLLILVCQIYKIIQEKNPKKNKKKLSEAYTMDKNSDGNIDLAEYDDFLKKRMNFNEDTVNYYDDLLYKNKKTKELKATHDYNTWLHLNEKGVLIEEENYGFEGFYNKSGRGDYNEEIDKCRAITSCDMLDKPGYENCGYCGQIGEKKGGGGGEQYNQDGKFDYKPKVTGGKIIGPDVCPADSLEPNLRKGKFELEEIGNRWATSAYDCKKVQVQDKCNSVKNCNELADDSEDGLGNICGWCPADKAYPTDSEHQLRYNQAEEPDHSRVKGDTCEALTQVFKPPDCDSDTCAVPYFEKLLRGTECSSCDNEGGGEVINGRYRHSKACLTDLWTTPMVEGESKINVTCSTDYDGGQSGETGEEGGLYDKNYGDKDIIAEGGTRNNSGWGRYPYFKVQNDMNTRVIYPIYKFKKDYNSKIRGFPKWKWGDEYGETPQGNSRRKWKMNTDYNTTFSVTPGLTHAHEKDIDTLWKQCFNLENKNNDLKCVPIDEIKAMEGSLNEKSSDPYITKDEYYKNWVTKCGGLTGKYECASKLDDEGKLDDDGTVKCKIQNL